MVAFVVVGLASIALDGCSLPGRAFPGGPSPWLPGGAPGAVYGPLPATVPVPATSGRSPAAAKLQDGPGLMAGETGGTKDHDFAPTRPHDAAFATIRHLEALDPVTLSSMISSLLVVCTGNICRSPMAAAVVAARAASAGASLKVASAGTAALVGRPPPPEALELMAERGMDISRHRGRQVTGPMACLHDLILVMEATQQFYMEQRWPVLKGRVWRIGEARSEDVIDPYGESREIFLQSLAQIEAGADYWSRFLFS